MCLARSSGRSGAPNRVRYSGDAHATRRLASNGREWRDAPGCAHPVIRKVAIWVNDSVDSARRRELWPLVPRIMGTASGDRKTDVRTGVALAVWAAEQVHGSDPQ